jgi:hypothetical protein
MLAPEAPAAAAPDAVAELPPRSRSLLFAGLFVMITASSSLYSLLAPFFPTQAEDKGVSTILVGAAPAPHSWRARATAAGC